MKLLLENWREYLKEEGDEPFVFHHATSLPLEKFKSLFVHVYTPEQIAAMERVGRLQGNPEKVSPVRFNPRQRKTGTKHSTGEGLYGSIPGSRFDRIWWDMRKYVYKITIDDPTARYEVFPGGEVLVLDYEKINPENIELVRENPAE